MEHLTLMEAKISELMRKGAAQTLAGAHEFGFWEADGFHTCALGALLYAIKPDFLNDPIVDEDEAADLVLETLDFNLQIGILVENIPADIVDEVIAPQFAELPTYYELLALVARTNDLMGRERAIQLVEELGY